MNLTLGRGVGVTGRLLLLSPRGAHGFCQKTELPGITFSQERVSPGQSPAYGTQPLLGRPAFVDVPGRPRPEY